MNKTEYLLTCITEEGGEISQAAAKCLRFGMFDTHPKNDNVPNVNLLVNEINDMLGVAELLKESGFTVFGKIGDREAIDAKKEKVIRWMDYSRELGLVE